VVHTYIYTTTKEYPLFSYKYLFEKSGLPFRVVHPVIPLELFRQTTSYKLRGNQLTPFTKAANPNILPRIRELVAENTPIQQKSDTNSRICTRMLGFKVFSL
jgi:hypothetical protein